MTFITGGIGHTDMKVLKIRCPMLGKNELEGDVYKRQVHGSDLRPVIAFAILSFCRYV